MRFWLLLCPLALVTLAPAAHAAVPSPSASTVAPCLIVCPSGDFHFYGVVRDFASNPVAGSMVVIQFSTCPTIFLCGGSGRPGKALAAADVQQFTDAQGRFDFAIQGGGVCDVPVNIFADGVLLTNRVVASPDQNGDLMVNAVDGALVTAKVGSSDRTADFDCDGFVTSSDEFQFGRHVGHACDMPVETRARTWGRVKVIYR